MRMLYTLCGLTYLVSTLKIPGGYVIEPLTWLDGYPHNQVLIMDRMLYGVSWVPEMYFWRWLSKLRRGSSFIEWREVRGRTEWL